MKIEILNKALRKAATFALRDFNEIKYLRHNTAKTDSFVNSCQERMKEVVLHECEKYFPEHQILTPGQEPQQNSSYLMFETLDSKANMAGGLPFFGTIIFSSTVKTNVVVENAMIYLPPTDQFCYLSSTDGIFIEAGNNSAKKRASISSNQQLCVAEKLSPALLAQFNSLAIAPEELRVVGSPAYALMLFASAGANSCILDSSNKLACLVADLMASKLGLSKKHVGDCIIYHTQISTRAKLSLLRQN